MKNSLSLSFLISCLVAISAQAQTLVPDTLFGTNGIFRSPSGFAGALATFRQADGKLLSVGPQSNDVFMQKMKPCGNLDSTFGTDGRIGTRHLEVSISPAMVQQANDGKIYVGGTCRKAGRNYDLPYLIRFNANGTVDEQFADTGRVIFDVQSNIPNFGRDLEVFRLLADGKILCAGGTAERFFVARLNDNGSLDNSFGNGGITYLNPGLPNQNSFVKGKGYLLSDGSMVLTKTFYVSGQDVSTCMALVKPDGTFDASIGTNGLVNTGSKPGFSSFQKVADKFVAIELALTDSTRYFFRRWNANFTNDASFGTQGALRIFGNRSGSWQQMLFLPDNSFYLLGQNGVNFTLSLLRKYNADYTINSSFGTGGELSFRFAPSGTGNPNFQRMGHMFLLPSGELMTVGSSGNTNSPTFTSIIYNSFIPTTNRPKISYAAPMLTSTGVGSFLWHLNNTPIATATTNTHQPTASGAYKVRLTDGKGCSIFSNTLNLTVSSVAELAKMGVEIFPNPASSLLHIKHNKPIVRFELMSLDGRKVLERQMLNNGLESISLDELPSGIYLLKLETGQANETIKVIKD